MVLSCALIRLLVVLCVQSKDIINTQANFFSFNYQLAEGPLSGEVTFIVLPVASDTSQSESFEDKNAPKALKMPEIEESSTFLNCSTLLEGLKLKKNSIVLRLSSMDSLKLVNYKCSNPVTNLLAYFTVDDSIELESNKELQHSILKFVSMSSLTNTKNKRILQTLDSFNDLVLSLDGCVPCAINQFKDLELLSSDELTDVYLMLSNYNEVVIGSKNHYNLSILCEMNPSVLAATKLLKVTNFRQGKLICQSFRYAFCETYEELSENNPCSVKLEDLIITLLEFSNTCYSTYFYYQLDHFDYKSNYLNHYYGMTLSAVNVIIHMYGKVGDLDFNYNTICGNNKSQIKLQFIKHNCDYYNSIVYLKSCGVCSTYVYDIIAIFANYNGYGDYIFRFIYDGGYYHIYNLCNSKFNDNQYSRSCYESSNIIAQVNMYNPAETNTNIQVYNSKATITESSTNTISIRLHDYFFYYYYITYINCDTPLSNGICATCKPNYFRDTDGKCYLLDTNCLNYNDPYLRCSLCKNGYRLTELFTCEKCLDFCLRCNSSNCIECEDGYRLNSDYTCSKCEDNCADCSYSLCLSCIDGYFLDPYNNCVKCEIGCSNCTDLHTCKACDNGLYLNDLDKNNVYCIECENNCLKCDENYCIKCNSSYTRYNSSSCFYCGNNSNCEDCYYNDSCRLCYSGYALNNESNCVSVSGDSGCKIINSNLSCIACRSGYIEKVGLCESCVTCLDCNDFGCKTCQEENKCLTCHDGYYLDQTTSTCLNCTSPCSTCTDSVNCSSCKDNLCLSSSNPYTCGKHKDCDKCLTNLMCRTCKFDMMIPSDVGCKCIDGYYRGNHDNCIKCKEICGTCTDSISCSECKALNSTYDPDLGCVCDQGFFLAKEMNNLDACMPCNSTCKECNEEDVCSTCVALNSTYITNLGCICDDGFFQSKEMSHSDACSPCNNTCKKCGTEHECLICTALNSNYSRNSGCTCDKGYFQLKEMNNSDACMLCDSTCKECYTEKNCSICTSLNSTFIDGSGCECDEGFYQVKEMNNSDACMRCNSTCRECNEKDVCLTCTALNSTFIANLGCVCDEGFFKNKEMRHSDACLPCNSTCKSCENENDCLICKASNSTFIANLSCECDEGFFKSKEMNNSDACLPCNSTCKSCENENECLICKASNSTYDPNSGCLCDKGFYQEKEMNNSEACMPCNDTCQECYTEKNCSICTSLNSSFGDESRCECDKGFYQVKEMNNIEACMECNNTCKECTDKDVCSVCTALNSSYNSSLGCVCDEGFFQVKEMNFSDACLPCNSTCKTCETKNKCLICAASNSNFIQDLGCVCKIGFYQDKEMNNTDACKLCNIDCKECKGTNDCSECIASNARDVGKGCECNEGFYQVENLDNPNACKLCLPNCKYCNSSSTCLTCKDKNFLFKQQCLKCGSLIPSTAVNAIFLDTFIDVLIEFNGNFSTLKCSNLFGKNNTDADKFGKDFICQVKSHNQILIQLGSNSTLVNETVTIHNFFFPPDDECMIKIKFEYSYSEALPYPTANILFVPRIIYYNKTDLEMNGELSSGWYKGELDYHWAITSNTSDLKDYSNRKESSLKIPKSDLNEGVIDVNLTVTNKFNLSHTVEKQILCKKEILIVDFNAVSNYSCKISQNCEFFISKISPYNAEDTFKYSWELTSGENLTVRGIELLNQSSVIIKPNSFKQGTIGLTVTVTNQKYITGSGQIFIDILAEKPIIVLDRAIGSIPLKADFYVSASQSMNTNLNCTSKDEKCLNFEWTCYKVDKECNFTYDKNKDHLSISKNFVKNKEFDSIMLAISSVDGIESRVHLSVDFVDINYAPVVLLREYYSKRTPSRIQLQKDFVVEAVVRNNDNKDYLKYWMLRNNTGNVFLGNNSVIAVNKDHLKQGLEYRLTFILNVDDFNLSYFYNFTVNSPPKPGEISVEPKSGIALIDKFDISATDWVDLESDYPLLYSFGIYSNLRRFSLISKQSNQFFSTFLTFIGDEMHAYVQVYDSLGDFTEMSQLISVNNSEDIDYLVKKMKDELSTEMTQNIPALIYGIATGILNREFYSQGNFSNFNSSENSYLQEGFELSNSYLSDYLNKSQNSKDLVSQISKILVELTLNPSLKSSNNTNLTVNNMNSLLEKSESFGLETAQSKSFYEVLDNSFTHSADLIMVNTQELSTLTASYERVNKGRVKNIYLNQSESFKSNKAETKLIGLESNKLEKSKYSLSKGSVLFPLYNAELNLTEHPKIVISLTYIPLEKIENYTQNLMIISVFDLESNNQLKVRTNSSIAIEIPFDYENGLDKSISCLFFDYSNEQWSNQGCSMSNFTQNSIICECNHLSTFTAGNYQLSPKGELDFTSLEAIAFWICLIISLIYLFLALLCFFKDRKELKDTHDSILTRENEVGRNDVIENINVSVNEEEDQETARQSREVNHTDIMLRIKGSFKSQSLEESKIENGPEGRKKIEDNFDKNQILDQENEENFNEEVKMGQIDLNNIQPINNNNLDLAINTISRKQAFKEEFKALTIYFYTDPNHCRLYHSFSVLFQILGNIFITTLYFNGQNSDLTFDEAVHQYKNISIESIFLSHFILIFIEVLFHFIFKEKDLTSEDMDLDNFKKHSKNNFIKVIIALVIYVISIIFFCYGTITIIQNLGPGVSGKWALTLGVSFLIEILSALLIKTLFRVFVWHYRVLLWLKIVKCYEECTMSRRTRTLPILD